MTKSDYWKLSLTIFTLMVGISLITPFSDRPLEQYALSQVTSDANSSNHMGHETFKEVIDNLTDQLGESDSIDYRKLKEYGQRNRLD